MANVKPSRTLLPGVSIPSALENAENMPSSSSTLALETTSLPVNLGFRKKVAIVGGGCSGIAALWALKNTDHDVYLYEAADRLGGHTNTVEWRYGERTTNVDTGFIVLNTATYRELQLFS